MRKSLVWVYTEEILQGLVSIFLQIKQNKTTGAINKLPTRLNDGDIPEIIKHHVSLLLSFHTKKYNTHEMICVN